MSSDKENLNLPLPTYDINSVLNEVESLFLKPNRQIDKINLSKYQRIVPIKEAPRIHDLTLGLDVQELNTKLDLEFERDTITNKVVNFKQHVKSLDTSSTDQSFQRPLGKNYVRGSSNQMPFLPGGIDQQDDQNMKDLLQQRKNWLNFDEFVDNLNTSDPQSTIVLEGFDRGLYLPESGGSQTDVGGTGDLGGNELNLDYLFNEESSPEKKFVDQLVDEEDEEKEFEQLLSSNLKELELSKSSEDDEISRDIDTLLPSNDEDFSLPSAPPQKTRTDLKEWAHMVDLSTLPQDYDEVVSELAHPFPFELDIFQKQAIYHLENNDNIFVAAHTSAGKTVVAEYAIALAQNHMTRAIYTSPIKALSNQKFRDFSKTFPEVGILTGDVQIKPESTCLIMTTEILRSMLYQGADLIRDVEFVIFDEVHYLNDAERGVVWEEVIIMLPPHITIILLSATVPNTKEFAEWIGRTKKRDVFVISTLKRPVPLEHYLYCNKELFKIINQNKQFLPLGWKQASDHLTKKDKERPSNQGNKRGRGGGSHSNQVSRSGGQGGKPFERLDRTLWVHLIGTLKQKNLLPVVIFAFSRKKCEEFADQLPNTDLTTSVEKSEIHLFLRKSLIRLKGEDRLLPQILKVSEWISRGIAVHHGGLLPIVKEIVEILFSRGLIKILFATETFAMGVNMPTRTVVFSGIRKFTGTEYRDLLPGEYTQMSGRAGRRGLDSTGMVIIVSQGDEVPDTVTLTKMILGPSTQLESQFRLTYSMIITLLRVEAFKVEDMIKRSFSENANQKLLPNKQKLLDERQSELDNLATLNCNICEKDIADYFKKDSKVREICKEVNEFIVQSSVGSKALSMGRVVVINNSMIKNCLAVVLKGAGNLGKSGGGQGNKGFYCLVLVDKSTESNNKDFDLELNSTILPFTHLEKPETPGYKVLPVPVKDFNLISDINFQVNSDAIVDKKSDLESLQCMQNLLGLFDQLPLTEYDFKRLKLLKFQELNREKLELISSLRSDYNCIKCPDFLSHYRIISEEETLRSQLNDLYHVLSDQNLDLLPDYENRILVLMELNFIDDSMTVLLKGRVACEIKTADELLLTELILSNFFGAYTPEECVALLSCFIFQERLASEPNLTDNLLEGKNQILALAQTVGNIQVSKGVNISLEDYVQSFKFSLTEVVYEWAKGMTFKQITDLTTVQEGSIVRCMTRLNDLCRDVRNGARVIGDHGLYQKMEHASMCIRRDIVFAASLYL